MRYNFPGKNENFLPTSIEWINEFDTISPPPKVSMISVLVNGYFVFVINSSKFYYPNSKICIYKLS